MRFFSLPLLLGLSSAAFANQALDVLEGKVDASSITLPPAAILEGETEATGKAAAPIFLSPEWAASPLDPVWARSLVYDDVSNPWAQKVAITGLFDFSSTSGKAEIDAVGGAPNNDTDLDGTRARRSRLGARVLAFQNTEIDAVGEFAGSSNYRGIERVKAYTPISSDMGITYGKFTPRFGADSGFSQSAYPNPTNIVSMVAPASTLGMNLTHSHNENDLHLGWFSSDFNPQLGGLSDRGMLYLGLDRTLVESSQDSSTRTTLNVDYIHNFDSGRSNPQGYEIAGRRSANRNQLIVQNPAYRHLFSIGVNQDSGKSTFNGEFQFAQGDTSVWGMTLGGTHWLIPGMVNLVGRYQYAGTKDVRGIFSTPGNSNELRYDLSPFFVGDEYHSFYLGTNLHLHKDGLVIQNGIEYMLLGDESGAGFNTEAFTWQTGAQFAF